MNRIDAHTLLGLDPLEDHSPESIKKAYKKAALKFHPDKNTNEDATKKFIEITEAYNYLGEQSDTDDFDFVSIPDNIEQLFNSMFMTSESLFTVIVDRIDRYASSKAFRKKEELRQNNCPIEHKITKNIKIRNSVTLEDIHSFKTKKMTVTRVRRCPKCLENICEFCQFKDLEICNLCDNHGFSASEDCERCSGKMYVVQDRQFTVPLNKYMIVFEEEADQLPKHSLSGDIIVINKIKLPDNYKFLNKSDIMVTKYLDLYEYLIEFSKDVELPDGSTVNLEEENYYIQENKIYELGTFGIPGAYSDSEHDGNMYLTFELDPEEINTFKNLMESLEE